MLCLAAISTFAACPERTLSLASITEVAGRQAALSISLVGTGNENGLSFSLSFDPTQLTYLGLSPGTGLAGASLLANTNQLALGQLGLLLAKPAAQSFASGSNELVRVLFLLPSHVATTTVAFADSPLTRQVVDTAANVLCANYTNAQIVITPLSLPAILADPVAQTLQPITNIATNATFTVTASGSPPLRYQWRWNITNLPGASATSLTLTNVGPAQAGNYDVVVANDGGAVTSKVAVLTLLPALIPPAIVLNPRSQLVSTGESVYLTVAASGSSPISYQWQRNTSNLDQATNSVLTLTNIALAQSGGYRALVTNRAGSTISQTATLTVSTNLRVARIVPSVVATAGSIDVPLELAGFGDESALGCSLNFDPASLSFLSVRLGTGSSGAGLLLNTNSLASGKLGLALTLPAGRTFPSGTNQLLLVRFIAGNISGPATIAFGDLPIARELADLLANPRPVSFRDGDVTVLASAPSIAQDPTSLIAPIFSSAVFQAVAAGSVPLSYQWQRNGVPLAGATGSSLSLNNVTPSLEGGYRLIVTNAAGSATSAVATLTVPRVVRAGTTNGPTGNLVEVPIELLATGDENSLGFSLDFDPAQMTAAGVSPGGALHGAAMNFNTNSPGHVGVIVSQPNNAVFGFGTQEVARIQFLLGQQPVTNVPPWSDRPVTRELADTNANPLNVQFRPGAVGIQLMSPQMTRQPASQTAWIGGTVTFDLAVSGSKPMTWRWQKNGSDLPGATNATLTLTNVQLADAANYSARISNAAGVVSSASALLTVLSARPDLFVNNLSAPTTAVPGQMVAVTWNLFNNGNADTPAGWWHTLWLAADTSGNNPQFVAALPFTNSLLVGQSLSVTGLVAVPSAVLGDRYFMVRADGSNDLAELNENNNAAVAAQSIHITSGDLVLGALSAPPNAQLGQTITVTWMVTNTANTPAIGPWQDRLYLGSSPNSLAGALTLLTVQAPASTLAPGAAYTNTQQVTLPGSPQVSPGSYYLTALADCLNNVIEFTQTNNSRSTPILLLSDYSISASNHPPLAGTITGTGSYLSGATSVLTASPAPGYNFVNWTEGGNTVGTDRVLTTVVYGNHLFVANYAEANILHVVTTATSPSGLATVAGAGLYTNGQSATFSAPPVVVSGQYDYFFQAFALTNVVVSTSSSFTKTFSTLDPTNLAYTALYTRLSLMPLVTNVTASAPNPVSAMTNLQLAFQFDRTMDTNFTPQLLLTNNAPGVVQAVAPPGGHWVSNTLSNDTFYPGAITLTLGMDGDIHVLLSGARDLLGVSLALTNVYAILLDTTPPTLSNIVATPAALSALIAWNSDQPSSSLVEYGGTAAYGLNSGWIGQLVTAHAVTINPLSPLTTYHYRVHSRDQVGNEAVSADHTFTTSAAPDLRVANLSVTGDAISGGNLLVSWTDTNSGSGATFTSWYDGVMITNRTTGQSIWNSSLYYDPAVNGNLASGGSRNRQLAVRLPDGTAGVGNLQVLVTVNAYENQYETNGTGSPYDNNVASYTLSSTLAPAPDLLITGLAITNSSLKSGSLVGLAWNDANVGNGPVSSSFSDQIVVVNQSTAQTLIHAVLADDAGVAPIAPGQSVRRQFSFVLPDGAAGTGPLQITITADTYNQVFEYNLGGTAKSNNSSSLATVSALAPYPDLVVSNVAAPLTASAGQTITLTWTDANRGAAAATNSWYDQVFLANSETSGDSELLGTFAYTNGLAVNQTTLLTHSVKLPQFVQGNKWLVVKANAAASFFELDTTNNRAISIQPIQITPTLLLSLSRASVSESAGTNSVLATLARNGSSANPLTVSLATVTGTNLYVPSTIVIPAGQNATTFPIGPIDWFISGSPVAETVTATAAGFPPVSVPLTILHDDLAVLSLTLSAGAVREDAAPGAVTGTVLRNVNFDQPLTVLLASDLPSALLVPNSVIIPRGAPSATFNLVPVNANMVGDTRRVHVLASTSGLSPVSAVLDVLNANFASLGLELADASVAKGAPRPATTGIVSRKPALPSPQNIALSVPDNALVSVPSVVTIPANADSASFSINVGDDQLATGPQSATILAQTLTPLGVVLSDGLASATLTILDTHGPSLSLHLAASSIAKGSNTSLTITRNTAPTNALTVSLGAAPLGAVTIPASALIPLGQSSVTCTVAGVLDNTQTGPRPVTFTASAPGFNSGIGTLTVSDIYLPDLIPTAIVAPTQGLTQQPVTVSWTVANRGLADAPGSWWDYVYLASDSLGQNSIVVAIVTNKSPLAVGSSYTNEATFYLPENLGDFWIGIRADAQGAVNEINRNNNSLFSTQPIRLQPVYRAELTSATPTVARAGTPVVLSGRTYNPADNSPLANRSATVRVMVYGTRRVYHVASDANGNFAFTFQPLANEAGDYTAGADYPQITADSSQVSFALLGMQASLATLNAQLLPNTPLTNQLVLSNLCDHSLSGLAVALPDLQGNLNAQFIFTNTTLPGGGALTVSYVLQSPLTRAAQMKFSTIVTSTEGAQLSIPTVVNVVPLVAQLNANPAYLAQGMLVGAQSVVAFDIINTGGAASGDLTLQLPASLPWMTLSSLPSVPSIPAGGRATVTLTLNPPADLPLTLYRGSLVAFNANAGLTVPFEFRALSDAKGALQVTATDDYTYYVAGAPKVTNATVTVRDAITSALIAQTNTDQSGIAYFSALPAGPYTVDASSSQHNPYRASAAVLPGATNQLEAFMPRQLVSYDWTVVPTEIPDHYTVQLESVFETEVPVPNVVIDQPQVMLFVWPGEAAQINLTLRNVGLIAAQNVSLSPPYDPDYVITPLVQNVGIIPAQSEVSVPVTVELRAAPATNALTKAALWKNNSGIQPKDLGMLCGCLKQFNLTVTYSYPCGGNNVAQQRSSLITPLCGPVGAKKCIDNIIKLTGSENMVSVGCNAVSALLSCAISLDPCVKTAIAMGCGAALGGVAGAASSGLKSLPACICAHLPNIPLPTFPPSSGSSDSDSITYGGGGNFGYYAAGFPVVTGYIIDTSCPKKTSIADAHTVRQIIRVPSALPLSAPIKPNTAGGVCAQVRLRINQDVVLTRTAFAGTLEIDNAGTSDITGIQIALTFQDATNGVAAGKFHTEGPVLSALSSVDGSGTLAAGASGSAVYTFIPTLDAAPDAPATFQIGGTLSYLDNGLPVTVPLLSAPITVYPEARLNLLYFQQRDVYGDDPFTPQIEPSEPFALGLIVKNIGAGNAHNFTITSGQPQIIENQKGLLIDFKIIGTQIGNQPISPSLTANLGDISPGATRQVTWDLISSLQGKFISFDATFTHVNDLGRLDTSLIRSVEIHPLTHQVLANRSTDDDLPDFLVNDFPNPDSLPDTLYLSDGSVAAVNVITNGVFDGQIGPGRLQVHLTTSAGEGWNYCQLPDPGPGYLLQQVVRADGKVIALTNNAWTTDRSFPSSSPGAVYENLLHLFDWAGPGAYTLYYHSTNTTAPAIVSLGPVSPFNQLGALSSVNLVFSAPVDTTTFTAANLALTLNHGPNLLAAGTPVSLTLLSNATYSITGLAPFTVADGNYQLTVHGAGIRDLWANDAGNISASIQWAKGNAAPVVQSIVPISPNPRNIPVTSVSVNFSQTINPATFNSQALSLRLDGGPNLIAGSVTITAQSSSSFLVGGLGPITGAQGTYVLSVNAAAVQDADGTPGFGSQSIAWTTITTGPTITALEPISTNPRNIVVRSLDVSFSEPIDPATFDYHDLSLTWNAGPNLITSDVTIAPLNPSTFRVGNFSWVQGHAGNYSFTIDAGGLADLAGNPGSGSTNQAWQIILDTPPAPANLRVTPDTGISSTDGLTATNSVTLSGNVPATNLTVRVFDVTASVDLGTATLAGTNFHALLSFSTIGQHRLQVQAVDAAGNVSSPTYFNLFVDSLAPIATLAAVAPNPRSAPVTNLTVTFSKPINVQTFSAANLLLTYNATNSFTPTLTMLSSNQFLIGGMAAFTKPLGTYQLALNLNGVQDLAGNINPNSLLITWQNVAANFAPVISPIADVILRPDTAFRVAVQASDPDSDQISFSLGANAPAGAAITANGVFTWTPSCAQAHTTNLIQVWATDNGSPFLSSSMIFTAIVSDCVRVQVGPGVVQVGQRGCLPVNVLSTGPLTNLTFTLLSPSNRFGNWAFTAANPVGTASVQALDPARTVCSLAAAPGQTLQGAVAAGYLCFTALSGSSAFVPLSLTNLSGINSGGATLSAFSGQAGRLVVVGNQPLLDIALGTSAHRALTLYGNPGELHYLEYRTNLTSAPWVNFLQITPTALATPITNAPVVEPMAFYRALTAPALTLSLGSTNLLAGENGFLPLTLTSASDLTNLTFQFTVTSLSLTNFAFTPALAEVTSASLTQLGANSYSATFILNPGLQTGTSRTLANLDFTALPNAASTIVPLTFTALSARQSNGNAVTNIIEMGGRIILVGARPVLDSTSPSTITLYGQPGSNYALFYATDLISPHWIEFSALTLTGRLATVSAPSSLGSMVFFKAAELPPFTLNLQPLGGSLFSLTFRGQTNFSYRLQTTTNLGGSAIWSDLSRLTLTNSAVSFIWTNRSQSKTYFRALSP